LFYCRCYLLVTVNKQHHNSQGEGNFPPSRESPLQEIPDLDKQRVAQTSSGIFNYPRKGQLEYPADVAVYTLLGTNGVVNSGIVKQQQSIKGGIPSNQDEKSVQRNYTTPWLIRHGKKDSVKDWLSEPTSRRRPLVGYGPPLKEVWADPPSPGDHSGSTETFSIELGMPFASVRDGDYRDSLGYRGIYIDEEEPPAELAQRMTRIISSQRVSPRIGGVTVQELEEALFRYKGSGEDTFTQEVFSEIVPKGTGKFGQRFQVNHKQAWSNSIPIPLKPTVLATLLPLPRPKPDTIFETAFTEIQWGVIGLLVDD
jgi:hypothetical protein